MDPDYLTDAFVCLGPPLPSITRPIALEVLAVRFDDQKWDHVVVAGRNAKALRSVMTVGTLNESTRAGAVGLSLWAGHLKKSTRICGRHDGHV